MRETMHHDRPDPNVCPHCGNDNSLRELAQRYTWQPVTLAYRTGEDIPAPVDYSAFQTNDETTNETYECEECGTEWPSLADLAHAQRVVKAITDHRDFWETRSERLKDLSNADRLDTVDGAKRIEYAEGAVYGFSQALAILRGNGEA